MHLLTVIDKNGINNEFDCQSAIEMVIMGNFSGRQINLRSNRDGLSVVLNAKFSAVQCCICKNLFFDLMESLSIRLST